MFQCVQLLFVVQQQVRLQAERRDLKRAQAAAMWQSGDSLVTVRIAATSAQLANEPVAKGQKGAKRTKRAYYNVVD